MLVAEAGFGFPHAFEVHDRGTAQPEELFRRELRFKRSQRLAQRVLLISDMEHDVIPRRLDPVDVFRLDESHPFALPDRNAADGGGFCCGTLVEERANTRRQSVFVARREMLARVSDRCGEPGRFERLEQVVERVDFEGLDRVTIKRGHENYHGQVTDVCPFANLPNSKKSHWGEGITAEQMKELRWVMPRIVAQISFVEWTRGGNLRHGTFKAVREDKNPREVVREMPK